MIALATASVALAIVAIWTFVWSEIGFRKWQRLLRNEEWRRGL